MDIFDNIGNGSKNNGSNAIPYGREKSPGGHDHRTNKGSDRTPSQHRGDHKRRK